MNSHTPHRLTAILTAALAMLPCLPAVSAAQPPEVKRARPTAEQAAWQELELGLFIHDQTTDAAREVYGHPAVAAGGRFDVVRDGKPACAIVIAERPSRAAQLAALELQSHVLKLWDDPGVDTDALLDEFFTLYFGHAARPMSQFYRSIESIACDQALYPPKLHRQNKDIAWRNLGTPDRMQHLAALIAEAGALAGTGLERKRVDLWRNSIWEWMLDGRAEFEARTPTSDAKLVRPAENTGPIDRATLDAWSAPYRGWHYHAEPVIPSDLKIPGHEKFHSFDVPTVYQVPGQPGKWFMSFIGFNGQGYNSFVVESTNLVRWTHPRRAMGFGPPNEFDHGGCVGGAFLYESYDMKAPRVLKKRDGKYWTLYGCYPRQGGYELRPGYEGVAVSDDGLTWRRARNAPILVVQDSDCGPWEKDCIYQPWLVEHRGRFFNFYNAANGGTEQMGGATSTNCPQDLPGL